MDLSSRVGLPTPRECPGMAGIVVSLLGAAGSIWVLWAYDQSVWGFTLLALFAALGWTSFVWCGVWAQSTPEERSGAGFIGVVVGAIGLGVGLVFVVVFDGAMWGYTIAVLSFLVFAGSLVQWGRAE